MPGQFIALKSLSKSYGRHPAVRDISLDIPCGEIVGLLGPNGAGKSTTIAMLTGLLTPSSGAILWEDSSIFTRMREWRRVLGVVLEDLSLFEYLSVREHLYLTARLAGLDEKETIQRAAELIEFFQLEGFQETLASEASQGTRKKLAFALGLIHAPRILLLDEAFNGIDAVTVSRIKDLLRRLARRGMTIILSSHVLDAVETIINRCVIMDGGSVALDTRIDAIRASGRSLEQVYTSTLGAREVAPVLSWLE